MARRHYWQFLVTDEGNPIENAEITVYIAGTEDTANVYLDEIGGSATRTAPQTRTSRKGYFEFWIADTTEDDGYFYNQKFKIAWQSPGVSAGFIDYIDVFSTSVAEVDETSTDTLRNKAVSNFLAKGWEDHKNLVLFEDSVLEIHGITIVDEFMYDDTVLENTKYNKLISNVIANGWASHRGSYYNSDTNSWYYTVDGHNTYPVLPEIDGAPGNPHGIDFVDVSSTDSGTNRLISNALAKQWHDHRTNTALDEHTQYSHLDGRRDYTAGVGYSNGSIVLTVGDDDFVTKEYQDGQRIEVTIPTGSWTLDASGSYRYDIPMNLSPITHATPPTVTVWQSNSEIMPLESVYTGVEVEIHLYTDPAVSTFVRLSW